jgi:hypothetical protein
MLHTSDKLERLFESKKRRQKGRRYSHEVEELKPMIGYGIGIARLFVLQSPKSNSKQCRICTTVKSGPGGI